MELWIFWIMIGGFGLAIYLVLAAIDREKYESQRFIENHRRIRPGMTKAQVIYIMGMGHNYTQSYLSGGIEKLEWKYRHAGFTGRVAKGAYVHKSSLTRSISVKFKDDKVIEVKCLNMD